MKLPTPIISIMRHTKNRFAVSHHMGGGEDGNSRFIFEWPFSRQVVLPFFSEAIQRYA